MTSADQLEIERLRDLCERLKLEAQIHAQEARTQASIVKECYRAVTDGKGEPGDWNGARPVIDEIERLQAENAALRADAERFRYLRDTATSHWTGRDLVTRWQVSTKVFVGPTLGDAIDKARGKA